jgi:hypothetical protein
MFSSYTPRRALTISPEIRVQVQNLLIRLKSGIFVAFPEARPRKINHNGRSRRNRMRA